MLECSLSLYLFGFFGFIYLTRQSNSIGLDWPGLAWPALDWIGGFFPPRQAYHYNRQPWRCTACGTSITVCVVKTLTLKR